MPAEIHIEVRSRRTGNLTAEQLKEVADEVVDEIAAELEPVNQTRLAPWHATGGQAAQLYEYGGAQGVVLKVETYSTLRCAVLHLGLSAMARAEDAAKPLGERKLGREDHERMRSLCSEVVKGVCPRIRKRKAEPGVMVRFMDTYGEYAGVTGHVFSLGRCMKKGYIETIGVAGGATALFAGGLWVWSFLQNGTLYPSEDILVACVPATMAAAFIGSWHAFQYYCRGQRSEVRYET